MTAIDVVDMRARPNLKLNYENYKNYNKVTYVEFGKDDIIFIFDKGEE